MAVICNAIWTITPGRQHIVQEALAQLARATREEPGNRYYQPYVDPEAPHIIRIFEIYTDDAALTAHGKSDHFAKYALGTAIPELESREREIYETLDL